MTRRGRPPLTPHGTLVWNITLPTELVAAVELQLFDPLVGSVPYGARAQLLRELLSEWVEEKTRGVATLTELKQLAE